MVVVRTQPSMQPQQVSQKNQFYSVASWPSKVGQLHLGFLGNQVGMYQKEGNGSMKLLADRTWITGLPQDGSKYENREALKKCLSDSYVKVIESEQGLSFQICPRGRGGSGGEDPYGFDTEIIEPDGQILFGLFPAAPPYHPVNIQAETAAPVGTQYNSPL